MAEIQITLPDNSVKKVPKVLQLKISQILLGQSRKSSGGCQGQWNLKDLNAPTNDDSELQLFTGESPEGHDTLLHSTAHLMAQAVKELYPNAKVTIGPTIENGFYYDFDVDVSFSDEVLVKIEEKMRALAKSGQDIQRNEISAKDAVSLFKDMGEDYKVEIIQQINPDDVITIYKQSDFTDLCRGPHVSNTSKIKHFKLLSTSGAYWRGDENNKMLQRIYGTVFSTKDALKTHLHNLEEAKNETIENSVRN